jgi:hypothetical protein
VTPTWAKLIDFETTLPSAVEELARQRDQHLSGGRSPGRTPDPGGQASQRRYFLRRAFRHACPASSLSSPARPASSWYSSP